MIDITFRQIEIFVQVARSLNMRQVSQSMNMSHSAISMAISELEKIVGGSLFDRVKQRVVLNQRGRYVLDHFAPLLMQVDDHLTHLKNDVISGQLHVGGSTIIGNYLLPQLIGTFTAEVGESVDVRLHIGNTSAIESQLLAYTLDIALVEGPVSDTRNLVSVPWIEDQLCVISNQPPRHSEPVPLAQLVDQRWILREEGSGTLTAFEQVLNQQGIILSRTMMMGHTEAVKHAVEVGLGIACLSQFAVQRELDAGRLFQIPIVESLTRPVYRVTVKNRYESRLLQRFLEGLV
jgi:DNA-binding transcriptional LysR family regulator